MKRSRWIGLLMSAVLCFGTVFPMSACNSAKDGEDDQTGGETEEPYIPEELESNGIALENYQIVISAEASAAGKMSARSEESPFIFIVLSRLSFLMLEYIPLSSLEVMT